MKELTIKEVSAVSGGNIFWALAIYEVADLAYQFYQGYSDGYKGR